MAQTKTVKLHYVGPAASERGTVSEEPTFSGVRVVHYSSTLNKGMNWYNYLCDHKDYWIFLEEWITACRTTAKKDLARLAKLSEKEVSAPLAIAARMQLRGFPLNAEHSKAIHTYVDDLKRFDKVKTDAKPVSTGPSVQDRMRQQVTGILSDIDQAVDDMLVDNQKVDFDKLRDGIFNPTFKAPHLSIIDKYIKRYLGEWQEAVDAMNGKFKDETSVQLAQGYAYCGAKMLKTAIEKFSALTTTLSTETNKVKMQRIRKKKAVDKKKMVGKLKYLRKCDEIGVTSIDPVDIIGATMLWVYDCKKRKLGCYEGEFTGSLHIKGTTILGAKKSYQKILRKPKEQMVAFKKLRKNQTMNFLEAVRAKSQVMTGRTNADLILVRVD